MPKTSGSDKTKKILFTVSAAVNFHSPFRAAALPRLIYLVFIFAFPIAAQTISGTVTDSQNAPVQNAEVILINKTIIAAQTATDADGKFSLTASGERQNLRLRVSAKGFADFTKLLTIDNAAPLEIVLSPASLSEGVTVLITRTESRLSETPASVAVLSRETLQTTAAQSIDDALRQVAGFTLFRRSSSRTTNPTTQGANLRGISGSGASRAAVLLDGLSLNDAFGGWTFWSRVPKIAVEQVEVLRGGASQFYGSSALSGAVNLTTEHAEKDNPILRVETSIGAQNTFNGSAFGAIGKNGWNFSGSFDAFETRGYVPVSESERGAADSNANSRYRNGFLTIERKFGNKSESPASANGFFSGARVFLRGNLFGENRENGTRLQTNQTRFRQIASGADFGNEKTGAFQLRAFVERQVYDQTFSAVSPDRNTETLSRVQRVPSRASGANLFWSKVFGNHAVSGSVETCFVRGFTNETVFVSNRAASFVVAGGRERDFGFLAQDFWRITRKLNFSFGARFDDRKNFDAVSSTKSLTTNQINIVNFTARRQNAFSPRLAALYQIDHNFSLYGAYSKSFRAPTLNELYRAFRVGNVLTQANENLKAERADTTEAGVNFTGFAQKLSLRSNVFVTEVSNPVVSVTSAATANLITRRRQNVGKTRSRGLELDAEFAPHRDLRFSASFLLVDSRITSFPGNPDLIDKFLPQIPERQLTFQTFYRPRNKISLSLQARLSGAQFEDDLNALRLRSYFTLDAFSSYRVHKKVEVFAAVENIFDNRYDIGLTPTRTIAAPRFARVGLRFNLNDR